MPVTGPLWACSGTQNVTQQTTSHTTVTSAAQQCILPLWLVCHTCSLYQLKQRIIGSKPISKWVACKSFAKLPTQLISTSHTQKHMHTRTSTHTHIHTHTHTTHMHAHTNAPHTHTHTRAHRHTPTHPHTHTHTHPHPHTHTHPDHLVTGTGVHTPDTNGGIRRWCNGYCLRGRVTPAVAINTKDSSNDYTLGSSAVLMWAFPYTF